MHDRDSSRRIISAESLRKVHPNFNESGLTLAANYVRGHAEIHFDEVISALAAATALEMWGMYNDLCKQLVLLASQPIYAPTIVDIAAQNVTEKYKNEIFKIAISKINLISGQPLFPQIGLSALKELVRIFSQTTALEINKLKGIEKEEKRAEAAKCVMQTIARWKGDKELRPECFLSVLRGTSSILHSNEIEPAINAILDGSYLDKELLAATNEYTESGARETVLIKTEESELIRAGGGKSNTEAQNTTVRRYEFKGIELPNVKPSANGTRNYKILVEFDTTKAFLLSDKPKSIGVELEAIVNCDCDKLNRDCDKLS